MKGSATEVKPGQAAIKQYYKDMEAFKKQGISHEMAVRSAFQNLLAKTGKSFGWTLIPELSDTAAAGRIQPDGTMRDQFQMPRGYWEAKDSDDDLEKEIRAKFGKGYPASNIIFEDTRRGILYQNGKEVFEADLTNSGDLARLLNQFYSYQPPNIEQFEKAVEKFKDTVPDLAQGLIKLIKQAHKDNKKFIEAYDSFFELCKNSLNPNLRKDAVDEMLVQHLLTERLIRTIFDNPDFTRRNVIAAEVEKVITALTSKSFNRHEFLKSLDQFYVAIESAARELDDFTEKQHFLNNIYERFFQGFSVKVADTHGIVYTPQPVVKFMCNSVAEALKKEFGKELGSEDVYILDPCTGTGNFIVNLMKMVNKRKLPKLYLERLFANEVMLMPYYIAALNIEHAYYELTGNYEPFEGLCFVDTLDMAEGRQTQMSFMTKENTERVERQRKAPITVIIGNPPYNVGQLNENDNNKNREYEVIDQRIRETYAKDSKATNKNALWDAYVKFFRWATDRIGDRDGIVAFISNNGFLRGIAFDGFRHHLLNDFDLIYHFDFKGNARTSGERRRREAGNIFHDQIRCGVGITLLIRNSNSKKKSIRYHVVEDYWRSAKKLEYLDFFDSIEKIEWEQLSPNKKYEWLYSKSDAQFETFMPLGTKEGKAADDEDVESIFKLYSGGVKTNRDAIVYDFNRERLEERIKKFIDSYNSEVDRWKRAPKNANIDDFVDYDKVKWSSSLKSNLKRLYYTKFHKDRLKYSIYRPFTTMYLYYDNVLNERTYKMKYIFPLKNESDANRIISVPGIGNRAEWTALASNRVVNLTLTAIDGFQCFPFYVYDEDGSNRRENITAWALEQFRTQYKDKEIGKWDIFHYVYGLLHHPKYRKKYADCLRRELPRVPFAPDFWAFSNAGRELSDLHLNYEQAEEYELKWIIDEDLPLSYRVEDKMRLNKDKTKLKVNDSLTLAGIPKKAFEYRLGNRSALEWVIDQYRVKTDKRTGITSDPNRDDDPEYIVRLVGQVITVSLKTVDIVNSLPDDFGG